MEMQQPQPAPLTKDILLRSICQLEQSMKVVLNDVDIEVIENMKRQGKETDKYLHWEWKQGVGIYGLYKCYTILNDRRFLSEIENWFTRRIADGLPGKNVNTVAPMLTMACVYEETGNSRYLPLITEWAEWIINDMPRTAGGGIQHSHSESANEQELWDDTLFMTVLFLAKTGSMLNNQRYIDEAIYQILLHARYLADPASGLWYHGWTFNGRHNFAKALWGRGNAWITIAIPEFIAITNIDGWQRRLLQEILESQIMTLEQCQHQSGLWHTLLLEPDSYLEASATAGFAYGILKAAQLNLLDNNPRHTECALLAINAIVNNITASGELANVSYGTNVGADLQHYRDIPLRRMAYGQALALLAIAQALAITKGASEI